MAVHLACHPHGTEHDSRKQNKREVCQEPFQYVFWLPGSGAGSDELRKKEMHLGNLSCDGSIVWLVTRGTITFAAFAAMPSDDLNYESRQQSGGGYVFSRNRLLAGVWQYFFAQMALLNMLFTALLKTVCCPFWIRFSCTMLEDWPLGLLGSGVLAFCSSCWWSICLLSLLRRMAVYPVIDWSVHCLYKKDLF